MKRVALAVGLVALVTACKDGPTEPSPTTVTSIVVSAPAPSLEVGATMTATARLMNSRGDDVASKTPTWSSSAPGVATVDQSGVITAVAAGVTTITAAADNANGTFPLTVDIDRCANPLALNVGQMAVLSGPTAVSCIKLAATTTTAQVLFVAANASVTPDEKQTFTISLPAATASSVGSTNAMIASGVSAQLQRAAASLAASDDLELGIRRAERRTLFGARRPLAVAAATDAAGRASAAVLAAAAAVGDTITYRVPNVLVADLCTNYATIRAVVKAVSRKAQIAVDVNAPTGGLTTADFTDIGNEFDNLIFKTDTSWFGTPTDINKDTRITILYTPEVNKFTKKGAGTFIGGFFWGGDLLTKADYARFTPPVPCPQTNEQEVFYLLAADPAGAFGDPRGTAFVRQTTRGTIAHEFQHMISLGVRLYNPSATENEVDWMNEGLAHVAEEAVGRASRGFGDFHSLTSADVRGNAEDFNAFFAQNLSRFAGYLARPDTTSPTSKRAGPDLPPRGAAWALLRYAADQYSPANARQFFKRLSAGPDTGIANLVQKAGTPFDQIISGWLIANYTSNLNIAGLDPRFAYTSWNFRDAIAGSGSYPLRTNPPSPPLTATVNSGSGVYMLAARPAGDGVRTFSMRSTGGGNVTFPAARVYVVRVN